jgi:hypothetical protein
VEVCGAASTAGDEALSLPPRPAPPPGYVSLELIPRDVERPVEDAEDVNISVVLDEVRDAVMSIEQ